MRLAQGADFVYMRLLLALGLGSAAAAGEEFLSASTQLDDGALPAGLAGKLDF